MEVFGLPIIYTGNLYRSVENMIPDDSDGINQYPQPSHAKCGLPCMDEWVAYNAILRTTVYSHRKVEGHF